jgi:hypothetical protein
MILMCNERVCKLWMQVMSVNEYEYWYCLCVNVECKQQNDPPSQQRQEQRRSSLGNNNPGDLIILIR